MAQPKEKKGIFAFFQKILDFFLSLVRTPEQRRQAGWQKQEEFNKQQGADLRQQQQALLAGQKNRAANKITNLENEIAQREELIGLLEKSEKTPADQERILDIRKEIGATDNLAINQGGLKKDKEKLNRLLNPSTKPIALQDTSKKPVTPVTKASNKSKGTGFMRKAMGFFGLGNQKITPIKTSGAAKNSSLMIGTTPELTSLEKAQDKVPAHLKTLKEAQQQLEGIKAERGGPKKT